MKTCGCLIATPQPDDNPEKEMGRAARNPEATKVSDEEYLTGKLRPRQKMQRCKSKSKS